MADPILEEHRARLAGVIEQIGLARRRSMRRHALLGMAALSLIVGGLVALWAGRSTWVYAPLVALNAWTLACVLVDARYWLQQYGLLELGARISLQHFDAVARELVPERTPGGDPQV